MLFCDSSYSPVAIRLSAFKDHLVLVRSDPFKKTKLTVRMGQVSREDITSFLVAKGESLFFETDMTALI